MMPLSNEFATIPISIIKVREDRQRKNVNKASIQDLASSIQLHDLLHPIIIDRDNFLVAGERRLGAFKLLGRENIPVHYLDELDPIEAKVIELEENVQRKDLTWQEYVGAVNNYHEAKLASDGEWTMEKTAGALSITERYFRKIIQVANLSLKDENINNSESITAAINYAQRTMTRAVETELSQTSIEELISGKEPKEEQEVKEESVLLDDFTPWAQAYSDRRFNFVHCDFPYGIGYDKTSYHGSETDIKYDDSKDVFDSLLDALLTNRDKIFFPSSHLFFWFSMPDYQKVFDALTLGGFKVNTVPLIWHKSAGIIPDASRGPRRVYESAFMASLGDRKIIRPVPNLIYAAIKKHGHISTKPRNMLRHFFRMFIDEKSEVFDPTCGSGSALAAAKGLGAERVLGLEVEKKHVETANTLVRLTKVKQEEEDDD